MAKLQAVLDKLDDVPEPLRELYVEADGKYRLDADGVESLVDTSGLKSALEKERKAAKDAAAALKKYDGVDPERYAELLKAAEEAEAQKLQTEGKWEEMKQRLTDAHKKELDKSAGEVSKRDRVIEQLTVENELSAAIEKANILPEHRRTVRNHLKVEGGPKVVWEGDVPIGLMGEVPIAEYVESWAKTDEAAPYLPPSGAGGSGARGGGGGGGGVTSKSDLKTPRDKAAYIGKHGRDAYLDLPDS
jgi:hypothetical protein